MSTMRQILFASTTLVIATSVSAEQLSFYGTPGLVDMPTARSLDDGEVALTTSHFGAITRNTLTFQITPRLQGSFRYSYLQDFFDGIPTAARPDLYDRSFDLHYQIAQEGTWMPALAVGLRDFGGTGIFSSEYLVATKSISPALSGTIGLGWGRLAQRNSFRSPLANLDERFEIRPREFGIEETGQLDFGAWFRGDVALFGGVAWKASDQLTVVAEYSSDDYNDEVRRGIFTDESPVNVGFTYAFDNGIDLGGYYLYGSEIGATLSYTFDPGVAPVPSGTETNPPALQPRDHVAAASWQTQSGGATQTLASALSTQGIILEALSISGSVASIRVSNTQFGAEAQALGRTARIAANTLPVSVETFAVTFTQNDLPISTVHLQRRDLEELEFAVDGAWQSYARSRVTDAGPITREGEIAGLFPKLDYNLGVFVQTSFFDPESPIRAEFGPRISASYSPRPGLQFAGQIRKPVVGNIGTAERRSDSVLPHVRSDGVLFALESDVEISYLTMEYLFRPSSNTFGRVTAGYLEQMYGGVSTELLWHPVDSRLALGAELNFAALREFDQLLGFQDYDVLTGHASAYYDFGNGFHSQLDVGRYLAGDWGATLTLDREFNNGFKIGAFMTLTDVPFETFGEGSFDKGIRIEVPVSWLTGRPSRDTLGQTIRPILRDGGARLNVRNRLYGLSRDYRETELSDQWGRFWR